MRKVDIHYTAEPALAHPVAFLRGALLDLRASAYPAAILFRSSLRARHRRAWLGYLWLVVPALATAMACTVLHASKIVAVSATALPYPLFVLTGMMLWQCFWDAIAMPQQQLAAHRQMLTRTPVPPEAVLLAGLCELAMTAAIRLGLMVVAAAVIGPPAAASWLLLPVGAAALIGVGLAVGLFLAPVGLLYDDVGRAIGLLGTFALLLSPVLYPVPAGSVLRFNPIAPLLDGARGSLTGVGYTPAFFIIGALGPLGVVLGWLGYRLARTHLAERLG